MTTVANRVAAGARLLTEYDPMWRVRVDPDQLDMTSSWDCVAGQVMGRSYPAATWGLGLRDHDEAVQYGFAAPVSTDEPDYQQRVAELEDEWRKVLAL